MPPLPRNRGQRCQKWRRVRLGGRRVLRCVAFTYPPRRPGGMGYRRGHVPDNHGKRCRRFQRVYSPWFDQKVWRCASYGPRARRRLLAVPARPKLRLLPQAATVATRVVRALPPPAARRLLLTEGYIPLSLPSLEQMKAGRTPQRG